LAFANEEKKVILKKELKWRNIIFLALPRVRHNKSSYTSNVWKPCRCFYTSKHFFLALSGFWSFSFSNGHKYLWHLLMRKRK
jgi:hypothetical protein